MYQNINAIPATSNLTEYLLINHVRAPIIFTNSQITPFNVFNNSINFWYVQEAVNNVLVQIVVNAVLIEV